MNKRKIRYMLITKEQGESKNIQWDSAELMGNDKIYIYEKLTSIFQSLVFWPNLGSHICNL